MNQQNASMLLPEAQQQADRLFGQIGSLIEQARTQVHRAVNSAMVSCYWQIGCLIVESEQQGQTRAAYGQQLLAQLAVQLTSRFGKGFDASNLRNMRRFYLAFPIQETVSLELSWSHYNLLSRIDNPAARQWYQTEAISQNWSVRACVCRLGWNRPIKRHRSNP